MRAIVIDQWMDPAGLRVSDAPPPSARAGQVLLDVRAAGVNFFDLLIVQGRYQVKPPFPFSPGGEVAGVVREVGEAASNLRPGDHVMARVGYGGFAEQVAAPAGAAYRIPEGMSFEHAAALPIVYGTAHAALVHRGALRSGETVLVTAAAGGVGLAAVQLAKALGARVIGLAGGDKLAAVREAGADTAIDYRSEDWVERVKAETAGRGADVIVENVGGDVFDGCTRGIAWAGRLVVVGFSSGKIPEMRMNRVMLKHISVVGVHWGPMSEHEPERVAETYRSLLELYAARRIEPKIWKVYPLEETAQALRALAGRETTGKIVIRP